MITFEQIQKANEGMNGVDFKGKNYVMVNSRVTAFRKLFPEGFIVTDLISNENGVCVMQAKVGYYVDGNPITLGTGLAYEKEASSYINKTSYIENCETSAVGRALGFLALGVDDSICSAEELVNAISNQDKKPTQEPARPAPQEPVKPAAKATITAKVPSANPVKDYIANEMSFLAEMYGTDAAGIKKKFAEMRKTMIAEGLIPDISSDAMTMEQASEMFEKLYGRFTPSGGAA